MVINEATARALGFVRPEDAVGKKYRQGGRSGTVIGVVRNFHFQSFREEVQPLTFQVGGILTFLTLNISTPDVSSTIDRIENKWKAIVPGLPLVYFFSDDAYNAQYVSEERFGDLFICFAVLAIVISCLGLFGLSAYSTAQRTREIGIRKVLGASVGGIINLLTRDFLTLIAVAFVLGVPVAWIAMNTWLQGFAYRIDIPWWLFILAGFMILLVAFVTIFTQTIRAANADPVKTLKAE